MHRPSALRLGLGLVPLVALSAGCSLFDNLVEPDDQELAIHRFSAAPEEVPRGAETTLQWQVSGADLVEIDQGVGPVSGTGSLRITPDRTTSYTLIAIGGTARASSTVQVRVQGTVSGTPTPTPRPGATPTPVPTPTPAPTPVTCGGLEGLPLNCNVAVAHHRSLPAGQCVQLNELLVDTPCPVAAGSRRVIGFTITAHTQDDRLLWRQGTGNADVLLPSEGVLSPDGSTTVLLNDTVNAASLSIVITDSAGRDLMSFALEHR